jgi:Na+/H+ antiporter NhaD/arsenite permease-like protein
LSVEGEVAFRVLGVPFEFFLFGGTLVGVALLHEHTLYVALTGLAVITTYEVGFVHFDLLQHMGHEWVTLSNLLGLLVGFALLADHFEKSHVPNWLPRILPDGWTGGLVLLAMVFVLSSFLDNIAAAMIGGTVAAQVYQRRVHIGFLAGIVAAANAGGSGSVVGDTTTTMMWIAGHGPLNVVHAYVAAVPALLVFGTIAALQQHRLQPIQRDPDAAVTIEWGRVGVVGAMLVSAVGANASMNVLAPEQADQGPFIALALWMALLVASAFRRTSWHLVADALKGAVFLLSLVMCASMMPVHELPPASWTSAFGLGFVSAVFDNIPLTALALEQGGYDWGMLAYAVGFGGSMVWFGSSAGVALSNSFHEAKNAVAYVRHGWHVALAYVVGFFVLYLLLGWRPE